MIRFWSRFLCSGWTHHHLLLPESLGLTRVSFGDEMERSEGVMAALPEPLLGPQEWRPGGRAAQREWDMVASCPENLRSLGRSRAAPSAHASPEVPGQRRSPLSGQASAWPGQRGGDLWIECVWPGFLPSPQPQPCTEPAVGAQPHSVLLRRAAVSLFFDQFPHLAHFLHPWWESL